MVVALGVRKTNGYKSFDGGISEGDTRPVYLLVLPDVALAWFGLRGVTFL